MGKIINVFTRDLPLILNVFTGEVPIYILLAIIAFLTVVQSALLKIMLKEYPYKKHLASAFVMKLISTIVASLVIFGANKQDILVFNSLAAFSSVALISIVVEYPLLLVLYRYKAKWKRGIAYAIALNITVFFILFCSEKIFWAADLFYYEYRIQKAISTWNHKEILKNETGYIYFISDLPSNSLERYSISSGKTERLDGTSFFAVLSSWCVSAGKLACMIDRGGIYKWDRYFSVLSLPDLSPISKVNVRETPTDSYNGTMSPIIDRSGNYIAMIEPLGEIVAQKNKTTHYVFGEKAKIHLCYVKNGEEFYQYPEIIIGGEGFDWSPDSRKIVFVNFRDKTLYTPSEGAMTGNISVGLSDKYPKYLYVYDLDARTLTELCEGTRPNWSPDGKSILFVKNRAAYVYSFETQKATKLLDQDSYAYKWSPTGNNIVCWSYGHLVVVNITDPGKKMIIKSNYYNSEFFWSKK